MSRIAYASNILTLCADMKQVGVWLASFDETQIQALSYGFVVVRHSGICCTREKRLETRASCALFPDDPFQDLVLSIFPHARPRSFDFIEP